MTIQLPNIVSAITLFPKFNFNRPKQEKYFAAVIKSNYTDPYINLSIETYLARKVNTLYNSHILFLCTSSDAVLIGKNQSYSRVCNIKKMTEDNVPLVRRDTQGEAYFVDKGNRLFSIMDGQSAVFHHQDSFSILKHSINQLNLKGKTAKYRGGIIDEVCVEDKIVSRPIVDIENDVHRHLGAIYIHTNMNKFDKYLHPQARRIDNLTDINPQITSEDFDRAIIQSYSECYKSIEVIELSEHNFSQVIEDVSLFNKIFNQYISNQFILNDNFITGNHD